MTQKSEKFRSITAIVAWLFFIIWLAMLGLGTFSIFKEGVPETINSLFMHGVLAVFWIVGIFGAKSCFNIPCVFLKINGQQAKLTEWYLWGRRTENFLVDLLRDVRVRQIEDSDGDSYVLMISTPQHPHLTLKEAYSRKFIEAEARRLLAALGRDESSFTFERKNKWDNVD